MKKFSLPLAIFVGMIAGIIFGILFPDKAYIAAPLGKIFLKALRIIVIPLIFVSIIDAIGRTGDMAKLSALGSKTVFYYLATNALAVITSLFVVNLIKPGLGVTFFGKETTALFEATDKNIFEVILSSQTLQIIFLAITIGAVTAVFRDKTNVLREFFRKANELILKITGFVILFAPFGVFGLLAPVAGDLNWQSAVGIGKFAITIFLALSIHACITLPLIFKTFSKRSFKEFLKAAGPALLGAFSTSSSSATLPITLRSMEKDAKISHETAGFVLPIGATVNMDGTAMYEAMACLFIAQAVGIDIGILGQITIFFTASIAAIGAAAIPSAGLVTLVMVLTAVNLPLEGIGFLLAFDRPFDMSRTTVNVWGDMVGCAVLEKNSESQKNDT